MLTRKEIELIRTILQDEVHRAEWEHSNDVSLGEWSLKYMNDAHRALDAFNRETLPFWTDEGRKIASGLFK